MKLRFFFAGAAAVSAALFLSPVWAQSGTPPIPAAAATELRRFPAPEARQAVAVDKDFFYAIDNAAIGKYDKKTGRKVAAWRDAPNGEVRHLNSGLVRDGKLFCVNSNYPDLPMMSAVEIFDCATLTHVGTHSFGIYEGSCTWVDFHDGSWWATFAHYDGTGGTPGKGSVYTSFVRFDTEWRRMAGWAFPQAVVARWQGKSCSGGFWGANDLLYTTGHDEQELYVLRLPRAGASLELVRIISFAGEGQGIARDPVEKNVIYGISRKTLAVIVMRLPGL